LSFLGFGETVGSRHASGKQEEHPVHDDEPKKKPHYQLGQDLSLLSHEELGETVAALKEEIARIEAEMSSKSASRDAAEAFFKL